MASVPKTTAKLQQLMATTATLNLTLKNGREVLIVRRDGEYTLYEGCELVVGDCSIGTIAGALILMNDNIGFR